MSDARAVRPVVAFDLDGTLLRGTTVAKLLAEWTGDREAMDELEASYGAGEIPNTAIADASGKWLAGKTRGDVWDVLARAAWIDGMAEALSTLTAAGSRLLLGTITWRFAAEMLREPHGFADVSGTEMETREDGTLTGIVSGYFDEHDKLRFVESWCARNGYSMANVAAVGDSRSDVPLFARAGLSIALNATADARAAATHVLDTDDLRDVLPLLGGAVSPR